MFLILTKNKTILGLLLVTFFSLPLVATHAQTSDVLFTKTLQIGSTGSEVSMLQEYLRQFPDIYPEGLVTGYFGPLTKNAVMRFQIKVGIEAVGIVGPQTRAKLNSLVANRVPGFPDTSPTSTFSQTINAGILSVDIVNASYVAVASPAVAMGTATFSFACQTVTGTFGTASEKIYVKNPDASDTGWTVGLAAATPAAFWDGPGAADYDFNDPTTAGCGESGTDADALIGQMTVNPSVGTRAIGQCLTCNTTGVTLGASAAFNQDTAVNSIEILSGDATSSDVGDWTAIGISISQTIPAEQAAGAYSIPLTLSILAT